MTEESTPQKLELNVLIAEDNQTNQTLLSRFLTRLGCTFDVAADGNEAFELAAKNTYQIVLMDLQMPGLSGTESAKKILDFYGDSAKPIIIALTGNSAEELADECTKAGMSDFMSKPFNRNALAGLLEKWTSQTA